MVVRKEPEIVFLGTGVSSGFPAWYCTCEFCDGARKNPSQWRTRSSIAILGEQTTLIDATPDISFQLNRECISRVDQVLLTHWHTDHVYGLPFLAEAVMLTGWDPIDVYLSEGDVHSFHRQMPFIAQFVELHPVRPGSTIELADATYEVLKTRHTEASVGYVVNSKKRFAYLLDTGYPSSDTIEKLRGIDVLIVEATLDFVEGAEAAFAAHLTLDDAIRLWREVDCPECIFTHFACHGVRGKFGENVIAQSFGHKQRMAYEEDNPGLILAYDGMRVSL